jgi:hypothetical protein
MLKRVGLSYPPVLLLSPLERDHLYIHRSYNNIKYLNTYFLSSQKKIPQLLFLKNMIYLALIRVVLEQVTGQVTTYLF